MNRCSFVKLNDHKNCHTGHKQEVLRLQASLSCISFTVPTGVQYRTGHFIHQQLYHCKCLTGAIKNVWTVQFVPWTPCLSPMAIYHSFCTAAHQSPIAKLFLPVTSKGPADKRGHNLSTV